jgi:ABC-2 type transport system permease protein
MTAITTPTGAAPAMGPKSSPATDTWYLTGRKLRALVRQPVVIAFGVVQPAIWLFLFGELFRKVIDIPGFGYHGSYLAYLVPGIVAMNAMSNNMWAGMTLIEEIDRGTLNRLLVTPASRLAIMNASVAEQAVGTIVQTLIIVGLAMAGGARYPGGMAGVVIVTVAAVLVGILWGALSNMTGMLLRSREAIIGVYTFFMLPLMFLSSAFMQPDFMPGWMQAIASRNPLNWEVQVGRSALSAAPDWAGIAERCGGLLALAILAVIISVTTFRCYAKNALSSGGHKPAAQALAEAIMPIGRQPAQG